MVRDASGGAAAPRSRRNPGMRRLAAAALLGVAPAVACAPGWRPAPGRAAPDDAAGPVFAIPAAGPPERIAVAALIARLADHRAVLLGERHDDPLHHRLQARLLAALAARGRHGAVVFEMLSLERAPELAALTARGPVAPGRLRRRVAWDRSGWPAFELYRPVFEVALGRGLQVLPGSPPESWTRAVLGGGLPALPEPAREFLRPLPDPPAPVRRAMAEEIRQAHCGHAPAAHLPGMVAVQWLRDAALAASVLRAAGRPPSPGVVLIAGAGHVRRDRGVPLHLRRLGFGGGVASLAFVGLPGIPGEVAPEQAVLRAFDGAPPFDFVWLTRPLSSGDPCERFREQLKRLGEGAPHAPGEP